jgi:NADPH:quinone reductase-like Zn-dependent oxidoreductase
LLPSLRHRIGYEVVAGPESVPGAPEKPYRDRSNIIPLIVGGSVKPIVERVYPLGEAGGALRHLIEDRPFGKVILTGRCAR